MWSLEKCAQRGGLQWGERVQELPKMSTELRGREGLERGPGSRGAGFSRAAGLGVLPVFRAPLRPRQPSR